MFRVVACLVALVTFCPAADAQQKNYLRYFNWINQAEEAIVENDFRKAVVFYDSIYHHYNFIFATDCFRATQVSVLAGDTAHAFLFLRKGFQQGMRKTDVEVDPVIPDLRQSTQWDTALNEYDSLHAIYLGHINQNLRARLIPIYEKEQYYNEESDNATGFKWISKVLLYKRKNRMYKDSLVSIIRTLGHFPGEQEIGVTDTGMYVFDSLSQRYYNPRKGRPFLYTNEYLILVHYYQMNGLKNYDSLLISSVFSGYLRPESFAFFSDNRVNKKKKDFYTPFRKMYKIFNKSSVSEKRKKYYRNLLNRNRAEIGCRSLEQDSAIRSRIKWLREEWGKKNYRVIHLE